MIQLRPYQQDFIDNVRGEFIQNHKRVVGVAPCGAGKTIMTGWMIKEAVQRGKKSIFFVHRKELIDQTADTFLKLAIPFGVICSGVEADLSLPVQIASVQTLAKRLDNVKKNFAPDFLICDECHHILANTYKKILNAFPNAFLLGVTATPQRMGGITLHDAFDRMVCSLSVRQLIKLGNLTSFDYFAFPSHINYNKIRTKFGEYVESDLADAMNDRKITGDIIETFQRVAGDKSAICYCVNVEHSMSVADAFNDADIRAAHVDGDTPKKERKELVEDFRKGKIQVLCNAELFGEGFDVPKCQAVILARPTKSLTLFIQQSMRSMRPDPDDPNKVAIIIDHVDNFMRHGLPDDERQWSLDPNKPKQAGVAPVKDCPKCRLVVPAATRICPHCGYQFEFNEIPPQVEGAHVKIYSSGDSDSVSIAVISKVNRLAAIAESRGYKKGWIAIRAVPSAKSRADFDYIGDTCGYQKGWAFHKWQEYLQKHS